MQIARIDKVIYFFTWFRYVIKICREEYIFSFVELISLKKFGTKRTNRKTFLKLLSESLPSLFCEDEYGVKNLFGSSISRKYLSPLISLTASIRETLITKVPENLVLRASNPKFSAGSYS